MGHQKNCSGEHGNFKLWIALFFLICFESLLFSQESRSRQMLHKVDCLESLGKIDSFYVSQVILLAYDLKFKNPELGFKYLNKALKEAKREKNDILLCNVYYQMGQLNAQMGHYALALENYLTCFRQLPSTSENYYQNGFVILDVGNLYFKQKNYKTAQMLYERSLISFKMIRNPVGVNVAESNIGLVKTKTGQYDSALYYFDRVLDRVSKEKDTLRLAYNCGWKADVFLQKNQLKESIEWYNKAISFSNILPDFMETKKLKARLFLNLGNVYLKFKDDHQAFPEIKKSIQLSRINNDFNLLYDAYILLSGYFEQNEKLNIALNYADSAYQVAKSKSILDMKKEATYRQCLILLKLGDNQSSLLKFKEYNTILDSIANEDFASKVSEIRSAMETSRLAFETEELVRKKETQNYIFLAVIGFLIVMVIFIVVILNIKRKNERRLKFFSNSTFEGILTHDGYKVLDCNDRAAMMMGGAVKDFIGLPVSYLVNNEYIDQVERSSGSSSVEEYEIEVTTLDHKKLLLEVFSRPFGSGGKNRVVALRDITQKRLAEDALRESQRKISTLLSNMPGLAYRSKNDQDWTMELVSEGCFSLTGYQPDDLIMNKNVSYFNLILPFYKDYLREKWQEVINNHQNFSEEYEIYTATGEIKWVMDRGCGVYDEEGEIIAREGIVIDVTEKHVNEEELKKYTEELQDANATKDKFFSIIAHDLKGPLHTIMGFVNIMYSDYHKFSDEEKLHFIGNIQKISMQLNRLLENLLDWSRSKTSSANFIPEPIDLKALLTECTDLINDQAKAKDISIELNVGAELQVIADENMVKTIYRNLLSNAVKFTYPGGKIHILASQVNEEVVVSVNDNGTGISPEEVSKLFKIGEKIGRTGTAKESGSGLGLILCRELVEKNGGRIWVESNPGEGSSFYFTLPIV